MWKIKGNFPCLHQFHLITLLGIATNSSPQILIRFRVSQSNVKVGEAVCGVAQPKQVFIPWWLNECHVAVSVSFILLFPPHCCVVPRRSKQKKNPACSYMKTKTPSGSRGVSPKQTSITSHPVGTNILTYGLPSPCALFLEVSLGCARMVVCFPASLPSLPSG